MNLIRLTNRLVNAFSSRINDLWYLQYPKNHIFDIKVDDDEFLMNFGDFSIKGNIIQRIEGVREPDTIVTLKSILKDDHRVLEIGSCYGFFTAIICKCVPRGNVVAVEPSKKEFGVLEETIKLNNFKNISAYRLFITNRVCVNNFGAKTKTIHEFLKEIKFTPEVIFMDIEGFEEEVIEDLFKHTELRPIIFFETHPNLYTKSLNNIKKILNKNKYCFRCMGRNLICYPKR